MAYNGTTSTAPNPPVLTQAWLAGSTMGQGGSTASRAMKQFLYKSTHTQVEAAAAGFITDAKSLGAQLGDSFLVIGATTYLISHHCVNTISSTGITLSAGLLVSSAS